MASLVQDFGGVLEKADLLRGNIISVCGFELNLNLREYVSCECVGSEGRILGVLIFLYAKVLLVVWCLSQVEKMLQKPKWRVDRYCCHKDGSCEEAPLIILCSFILSLASRLIHAS